MPIRLNPANVKQARQARKLSRSEVATYTKISESTLLRCEKGELEPSFKQLTRLSELYNVPLPAFYDREPLRLEATLIDFRKAQPGAADLSPRGLTRLWQIERRAKFAEELIRGLGESAPKIVNFSRLTNKSVPDAHELRAGFDSWLEDRAKGFRSPGPDEDTYLKYIRLFLDVRGCSTAVNSAPVEDYLGFFAEFTPRTRVIFVNRDIKNSKRRLFTLAHEIAHLIYDEEGVSNPFVAKNDIERRCNAYAAQFLAPDELVMRIVRSPRAPGVSDTSRLVTYLSRETLLSRQASALRLEELGVISRRAASAFFAYLATLNRVVEPKLETVQKKPMGAAAAIGKALSEVGVYTAYVASLALKKKIVDVVDVERGLGISEKIQPRVLDLATRRFEASVD